MLSLNHTLFLFLNAPEDPSTGALLVANFLALYAIFLVPLLLVGGWLRGTKLIRIGMLQAACAGVLGLLIAQVMGLAWPTPRPFMMGLGNQFLSHAADASFPSDHLTVWWSVALSLLWHARTRGVGAWLAIGGIPVAWARIYLGVHFPLDMLGAIAVAAVSAGVVQSCRLWLAGTPYRWASDVYRVLFRVAIRRGWLLP